MVLQIFKVIIEDFFESFHSDVQALNRTRGAYTARKLAGLIVNRPRPPSKISHQLLQDVIGLLKTKSLGLFFKIWKQLVKNEALTIPSDTRRVKIK